MPTAGAIVLESKIAIDIVLAEDGQYYVDSTTTISGKVVNLWTEGPFTTEAKARECLRRQHSLPTIEKLGEG